MGKFIKGVLVTALAAGVLAGSYVGGGKLIDMYKSSQRAKQEQQQKISDLEKTTLEMQEQMQGMDSKYYELAVGLAKIEPIQDTVLQGYVADNPDKVFSFIPEEKKAQYVADNFNMLDDDTKREIALGYLSQALEKKEAPQMPEVPDPAEAYQSKPTLKERVSGLGEKVNDLKPEWVKENIDQPIITAAQRAKTRSAELYSSSRDYVSGLLDKKPATNQVARPVGE